MTEFDIGDKVDANLKICRLPPHLGGRCFGCFVLEV